MQRGLQTVSAIGGSLVAIGVIKEFFIYDGKIIYIFLII